MEDSHGNTNEGADSVTQPTRCENCRKLEESERAVRGQRDAHEAMIKRMNDEERLMRRRVKDAEARAVELEAKLQRACEGAEALAHDLANEIAARRALEAKLAELRPSKPESAPQP